MKTPPTLVPHWWRRGLEDGKHCEAKRRERWFQDYAIAAESNLSEAGLLPLGSEGVFHFWFRRAFRIGYDNARLQREREKKYWPRKRKRAKLGK